VTGRNFVSRNFVIRPLTQASEMRALEDVQVAAWGYADREVLPGTMLRTSAATGGIVLAAYPADSDVPFGLAYGFPALVHGVSWHHSHLLAVAPEWRGSGAAVALKLAQRSAALGQGHRRMTWTFDPLLARNARLNLGKLGARAVSYHPDWYDLPGPIPADRLMTEWDLTQEPTERSDALPDGENVLEAAPDGRPNIQAYSSSGSTLLAPTLLAEVPINAETLPTDLRLHWRLALREVLGGFLERGYTVTGLAREGGRAWYVLERRP
jgi:predicted GNAT superfamily acetyltransferase